MNEKTHPYVPIVQALCAAMAQPVLFRPFEIDGVEYIDGAVVQHTPLVEDVSSTLVLVLMLESSTCLFYDATAKPCDYFRQLYNYVHQAIAMTKLAFYRRAKVVSFSAKCRGTFAASVLGCTANPGCKGTSNST